MHIGAQGARRSERQKTGQGSKKIHELLNAATYFFSSFRLVRHRLTLITPSYQATKPPFCAELLLFSFFFLFSEEKKNPHVSLMKLFSLMFEQQKQEPTSAVFKSYRGRKHFRAERFQLFEPIATDSRSLPTLQFSHLATVKLLKRYLSARLLCY